MQRFENLCCEYPVDAWNTGQLFYACPAYPLQTAKMIQQLTPPFGPHARDVFQCGTGRRLAAPATMPRDGESVCLVPHLLHQMGSG